MSAPFERNKTLPRVIAPRARHTILSALLGAIRANDIGAVRVLIQDPALTNDIREIGTNITPIHYATMYKRTEIAVELIASNRFDVNARTSGDFENRTALHMAALEDNPDIISALLFNGHALVDLLDSSGATPLLLAIERGNRDAILCLFSYGANIDRCDRTRVRDAVQYLYVRERYETVKVINSILGMGSFATLRLSHLRRNQACLIRSPSVYSRLESRGGEYSDRLPPNQTPRMVHAITK